jgi:hypothetical protein
VGGIPILCGGYREKGVEIIDIIVVRKFLDVFPKDF